MVWWYGILPGIVWCGMWSSEKPQCGVVWCAVAWCGVVWSGVGRHGVDRVVCVCGVGPDENLAWCGLVCGGVVRCGVVGYGLCGVYIYIL